MLERLNGPKTSTEVVLQNEFSDEAILEKKEVVCQEQISEDNKGNFRKLFNNFKNLRKKRSSIQDL